jgi:hypothetical protein
MRIAFIVALLAGGLAGPASVSAQDRSASVQASPTNRELTLSPWFAVAHPTTPFGNLFAPRARVARKPSPSNTQLLDGRPERRPEQPSTVRCGMTLIPADPKVDPAIRHAIPENGAQFTMQTVPPQVCRQ